MSIAYVSRVVSNVKRRVDVKLGPKTLIVGDNGAGKSAITDSISLALSGTVDEVAGKESTSQAIALMVLKAATEDAALFSSVEITTADGVQEADWSAEGSTAAAKRPKHRLPTIINENAVTIRDLRNVLAKGQDAIRDLFMQAISSEIDFSDVESLLVSEDAKTMYRDLVHDRNSEAAPPESAIEILEACIDIADKRKRDASAEATRLESLAAVTSEAPTKADLDASRKRFEEASKKRDEAAAKLGRVRAEHKQAQASGAASGVPAALRTLITMLTYQVDKKREECPICATQKPSSFFAERLKKAKAKAASLAVAPSVHVGHVVSKEETIALQELEAARRNESYANDDFARLCRAKEEFENYQHARQQKVKAERANALWKSVETELTTTRDSLLASGVTKLEARVQKYLGSGDTFKIVLGAGERRVCYYGLERNSHVDVALSGGEEVRVQIALACALAKGALNVVVPADRSLSEATLNAIMESTVDSPVQVIINTTTPITNVPDGWTLINLDSQVRS